MIAAVFWAVNMWVDKNKVTGIFEVGSERKVFGSLDIRGKNTSLVLFDDEEFPLVPDGYEYIRGRLHDGEFVTLMGCVLKEVHRRGSDKENLKCSATLLPDVVVIGSRYVSSSAECIQEVTVELRDAHSVFYDFDAFSSVIDTRPFVHLLERDKAHIRPVSIGQNPIIGYFSGNFDIASVVCELGTVKAHHRVNETMGGPKGWALRSSIMISLYFDAPILFSEAIERLDALVRFFELVIGRAQPLITLEAKLENQPKRERPLRVIRSHVPTVARNDGSRKYNSPGPADVLLCTVDDIHNYGKVLVGYFAMDRERRGARVRLKSNIRKSRSYSIDRVIAAANMFDILPDSAYPARVELSDDLKQARAIAQANFKRLPESIERNSILNALGRVGNLSLKHKVLSRMRQACLQDRFPGLELVLQEAINCRNHYVHGSVSKIDYSSNFDIVPFLTDALEFVFGVSDLVDSGWDYDVWVEELPQMDHPFGAFRLDYKGKFAIFQKLIQKGTE